MKERAKYKSLAQYFISSAMLYTVFVTSSASADELRGHDSSKGINPHIQSDELAASNTQPKPVLTADAKQEKTPHPLQRLIRFPWNQFWTKRNSQFSSSFTQGSHILSS